MVTTMAHRGPRRLLLQIHLIFIVLWLHHPSSSAGARTSNHTAAVAPPVACQPDQASSLLRLKRSFTTSNYSAAAFRSWRTGTDCCRWVGVRCGGADGRVTSLDLGDRGLESGGLDPALFDLTSLRYLDLGWNDFNGSQLPTRGFERLIKLTHLNLSSSGFSGQVPAGINTLTNLVSLDLSTSYETIELVDDGFIVWASNIDESFTEQNFETLITNLNNLRELYLGSVDLSNSRTQWCDALAVSCPRLEVLSLPFCRLTGPLCPFPDFFTNLSSLTVLNLRRNKLQGWISPAIFQHKKLVTIDLYRNREISGHLPNFSTDSRLENLNVGLTNFLGIIPASISNLIYLKMLGLGASGFSGELPSSIGNLKTLSALEISGMGIEGPIPSWVRNLTSLTTLQFYVCGLSGSIPFFISSLRHLKNLVLCDCNFSGQIPSHITNLTQLQQLLLYSNNFAGTMELTFFRKMPELFALDLSHNNLVVFDGEDNSSVTSPPKLTVLGLGGCSISKFPNFLRHQDEIKMLDLSDNEIHGAIPHWAWETWNYLPFFNLAGNRFTSIGYASFLPIEIDIFDLSNNMFEGPVPIPQGSSVVLDYINNRFSSVPSNFSSHLSEVTVFKVSGNNLSGKIPSSFCGGTSIQHLDLSYNDFNGSIPSCLMENVIGLQSLYLKENRLNGEFPDNIKEGCSIAALDFSGNLIKGQLPRSLLACRKLEVLNVGNNQISDSFPCWMSVLHGLQVLVLRSNQFFGQVMPSLGENKSNCAFPNARIVDISSNNFSGVLPQDQWFRELKSMIFKDPNNSWIMDHELPQGYGYYKYTIAITYKGRDTTFAEILSELVFIDFSNNAFSGSIPIAIGELGLLYGLNISHNFLTGSIPSQLGHLNRLEVLDLSSNELSGKIPQELASLDFLTTINLSDNKLVGSIPVSPHFLTFPNSSFEGNDGLCGPPLSKACINTTAPNAGSHRSEKKPVDVMLFLFVGLGFGVGFAIAIVVGWGIPIRKRS
ncbi:hypothetical protein ACP70R_030534 [Stipagrostis hirtigluma subsp. patula]